MGVTALEGRGGDSETENDAGILGDIDPNDNAGDSSGGLGLPVGCEGNREASGGDAKFESRTENESRTDVIEWELEDGVGESCDNGTGMNSGGSGGPGSDNELDSILLTSRDG